jgi:hypothetical protein
LGNSTSGHSFKHWTRQGTLLGLRVYTVFPLTRIVPYLALCVVETRALVAAPAPAEATSIESPPTTNNAPARRRNGISVAMIWVSSRGQSGLAGRHVKGKLTTTAFAPGQSPN